MFGPIPARENEPLPPTTLRPPGPKICQQRGLREASGGGLKGPLKRTIWRMVRFGSRFGVPYSKGGLTGYSPADDLSPLLTIMTAGLVS